MNGKKRVINYRVLGRSMSYYLVEMDGLFSAIWGQGGVEDKDVPELIKGGCIAFSNSDKSLVTNHINQSEEDFRRRYYPTVTLKSCYYKGKRGRRKTHEIVV